MPLANTLIFSGIAFTVVFYVAMFVAFTVGLVPRSEDYVHGGWLSAQYNERALRFSSPLSAICGITGAIIDAYILIVPLFFIWDLHTPLRRKAGISAIFITGSAYVVFPPWELAPILPGTNLIQGCHIFCDRCRLPLATRHNKQDGYLLDNNAHVCNEVSLKYVAPPALDTYRRQYH